MIRLVPIFSALFVALAVAAPNKVTVATQPAASQRAIAGLPGNEVIRQNATFAVEYVTVRSVINQTSVRGTISVPIDFVKRGRLITESTNLAAPSGSFVITGITKATQYHKGDVLDFRPLVSAWDGVSYADGRHFQMMNKMVKNTTQFANRTLEVVGPGVFEGNEGVYPDQPGFTEPVWVCKLSTKKPTTRPATQPYRYAITEGE